MRRLALALLLAACSPNVGPSGLAVGGPCVDDLDCAAGSFCLQGLGFPGGTCTTNCRDRGDCRGASTCVEESGGVCLLTCTVDDDCGREGYGCRERTLRGEAGAAFVCIGR